MTVLGITAHRVEKFRKPFETLGRTFDCLCVADRTGFDRYRTLLIEGRRRIKREKPDVIVANGADLVGFVAVFLGLCYGTPVVIRQGGNLWRQRTEKRRECLQRSDYIGYAVFRILSLLNKLTFRLTDGFIVVSEELKEITHGRTSCPRSRIKVVPPHIDVDRFEVDHSGPPQRTNGDENVVLTVTNLRYRGKLRGVCDALDEITTVLRNYPHTEYVIAGDGIYYETLVNYIETTTPQSIRDRIHAPGHVTDVTELYESADIFVYISYIDGYPNVVLEAQAAGLPVISNPAHGMPMQIEHGETGFLIDPSLEGALSERIEYLLDRPATRAEIGESSVERVTRENTADAIGVRLSEAIADIHDQL